MTLSKSSISVPRIGEMIRDWLPDGTRNSPADDRPAGADSANAVEARNLTQESTAPVVQTGEQSTADQAATISEVSRPPADPAEAALVREAQQNAEAFDVLYERYVDRVYAYIYNRVGNAQDSEDLTARTFYRALSRLHTYEDRGFPFSAWLFRIAHNLVANWHRDHSKRRFLSLDRLWSHSRDDELPERHIEQEEKHNALWDAINRLPDDRRDLLIYKFSSRLSNVEIGEIMNKSESAIKSLYFRTLAALRTDLESGNWEK